MSTPRSERARPFGPRPRPHPPTTTILTPLPGPQPPSPPPPGPHTLPPTHSGQLTVDSNFGQFLCAKFWPFLVKMVPKLMHGKALFVIKFNF